MPIFNIATENSLGISHSGEVMVYGEGTVELTDEQVKQLVELIKENDGEIDVESLDLETKLPDIYRILDEAYREVAFNAEYYHWVIEGYENGYYEVSDEEAMAKCEKYGFKFEYDEGDFIFEDEDEVDEDALNDAKSDAFYDWVEQYREGLDEKADALFLSEVFELEPDICDYNYKVEIPEEIVKMAL